MATAPKTSAVPSPDPAATPGMSNPKTPTVAVFDDNAGLYRWEILGPGGETFARSEAFTSRREATRAAELGCAGAALVGLGLPGAAETNA